MRRGWGSRARRGNGPAVAVVALCFLAVLLTLWGSSTAEPPLQAPSGEAGLPRSNLPVRDITPVTQAPEVVEIPVEEDEGRGVIPPEFFVIAVVLAAVIAWLVRVLMKAELEDDEPSPPDPGAELMLEATSPQVQRMLLAEGDPRNAVVACWVALEDAATSAGLIRDPAETSVEFAVRVLDRWSVPAEVIEQLGKLYREARFSSHPVEEEARQQAVAALTAVHDRILGAESVTP